MFMHSKPWEGAGEASKERSETTPSPAFREKNVSVGPAHENDPSVA